MTINQLRGGGITAKLLFKNKKINTLMDVDDEDLEESIKKFVTFLSKLG